MFFLQFKLYSSFILSEEEKQSGGTSTSFGQFSYLCPKGSEEAPIYIVQSERTTNSRAKMKGVFSSFKHGVPSTEESAGLT